MTDDLSNMRPRDVTDMLNSTPLGEVISERQLLRHRCNGGKDVGEGKRVNFLKYSAWLVDQYYGKMMKNDYELKKLHAAERSAMLSEEAREIGPLPPVVNLERKKKACEDFLYFCETYFSATFKMPWSEDHRKVIDRILRVISDGGLLAVGMPHGCGKSTIMQVACLWAVLSGRSGFAVLVAASVERAHKLLGDIKLWLMTNELLHEDFPEITVTIRALDDNPNRQRGQTYQGVPTRIIWSDNKITFPMIPGSAVSSGTIACGGLLGSDLRGMNHAKADGVVVRPDLIFIDDPQTRESAWSPKQVERRRHIIYTDILGMGGPSKNLSVILTCCVIRPDDLADEMLNRDKNPSWRGMRTKMVYEFPKNKGLWEEYRTIRNECLRKEGDISKATEFYVANREAMDEGAVVAWPERFKPDEKSAIQSAMNLKFRDESAFYAEYQNEPSGEVVAEELLSAEDIAAKVNGYDRIILPGDTKFVTAFIDIHNRALYWMICGWTDHFGGAIIDYGTWPEQDKPFFKLSEIRKTLLKKYECGALEDRISKGLEDLCEHIFKRKYRVEGGEDCLPVSLCLIDANWGQSRDVVYQFCRRNDFGLLMPSHGRHVGPSSTPFAEYEERPGDKAGHNWRIPNPSETGAGRHVLVDVNYWKSFVYERLAAGMGDEGCLSIFGRDSQEHNLLAAHITAEYKTKSFTIGNIVDVWKQRDGKPDNHWLDCLVGCAVGGSMLGVTLYGLNSRSSIIVRPRVKLSDIQRAKRLEYGRGRILTAEDFRRNRDY